MEEQTNMKMETQKRLDIDGLVLLQTMRKMNRKQKPFTHFCISNKQMSSRVTSCSKSFSC